MRVEIYIFICMYISYIHTHIVSPFLPHQNVFSTLFRPLLCANLTSMFFLFDFTYMCDASGCRVHVCVAVCCSVLQCVAVCCSVLQCVAVCCTRVDVEYMSVLQCVAVCCSVLQCVAVCCTRVDVEYMSHLYVIRHM